jgi:hypothetical protein
VATHGMKIFPEKEQETITFIQITSFARVHQIRYMEEPGPLLRENIILFK